ncbi:MAG TPA: hypothetical protein VML54_14180, partial [Candidatus Limnocylindrales bacterium]|nr:hypothetical protein [Candidatus Limnocylindrales bacterium]
DRSHHSELAKLAAAGHPVIRLTLKDAFDVGAEFFRWELATATAAALLGVNPFDEPDVTAAKDKTATLLAAWKKSRRLPEWRVAAETDTVALLMPPGSEAGTVAEGLAQHLALGQPGDYVAFLAYVLPHPDAWNRLQEIRTLVRDRYHLATTVAYGPRYLHSTGQLHKGGPPKGLFIQITGEDTEDPAIPGAGYGFGTLKAAQALGDLETLASTGRRVIRLHLRGKPLPALDKVAHLVRAATKKA